MKNPNKPLTIAEVRAWMDRWDETDSPMAVRIAKEWIAQQATIDKLQKRIATHEANARSALGVDADDFGDPITVALLSLKTITAAYKELTGKLPTTADGVPVVPGDDIYFAWSGGSGDSTSWPPVRAGVNTLRETAKLKLDSIYGDAADFYSTRAAAEAAKAKQ